MGRDPRFEVNVGERPAGDAIAEPGTFTIAILGDFSGRSGLRASDSAPLARRRAQRVDRDEVDAAIASFAPKLELSIESGQPPVALTFASLDDFHPDHIAERAALFQQLRALKRELASKGSAPPPRAPASSESRTNKAALNLGSGGLLDQIVDSAGGAAAPGQLGGVAPRDELSDFVADATRGHTVQDVGRDQQTLIDQIDGVIAATMRVVLHLPAFQALESLWRGVDFLVRRYDSNDVRVVLVDVTCDELVAAAEETPPWSLAIAAFSFGADDVALLGRLAAAAERGGVPIIAAADASFARTPSFDGGADPDDWDTSIPPGWDELRSRTSARFLSLVLPRFVLRLPYGKATDACETMAFEEMSSPEHEAYLWGNPALAAGALIAASVADGDDPPTQGVIENLPLHVARVNGEPTAKPAGEAWLSQRAVTLLLDRGLTPLETSRDGDSVRLPRMQSIAAPPRPLSFADR